MKPIKGYEGLYSITEDGDIWSYISGKWLKPTKVKGYLMVDLSKDKIKKKKLVHRLVAETYITNNNQGSFVIFKDKNPENVHKNNLKWGTNKEAQVGRDTSKYAENAKMRKRTRKLSDNDVRFIRSTKKFTTRQLATSYGVCPSTIHSIKSYKTYQDVKDTQ